MSTASGTMLVFLKDLQFNLNQKIVAWGGGGGWGKTQLHCPLSCDHLGLGPGQWPPPQVLYPWQSKWSNSKIDRGANFAFWIWEVFVFVCFINMICNLSNYLGGICICIFICICLLHQYDLQSVKWFGRCMCMCICICICLLHQHDLQSVKWFGRYARSREWCINSSSSSFFRENSIWRLISSNRLYAEHRTQLNILDQWVVAGHWNTQCGTEHNWLKPGTQNTKHKTQNVVLWT